MTSGQILPPEGLHAASPQKFAGAYTMTALEFLDMQHQSGFSSKPEDHVPFLAYETFSVTSSRSSSSSPSSRKRKFDEQDDDKGGVSLSKPSDGKVNIKEGDDVSSSNSESSDDDGAPDSGGVSLAYSFTVAEDTSMPFPMYSM